MGHFGSVKHRDIEDSEKIIFNRRLINDVLRDRYTTTCIASICNTGIAPIILLCADRLVSAGIQSEGGTSKIRVLTPNCYIMQSSNDPLLSDSIYYRLLQRIPHENTSMKKIVDTLCEECVNCKREQQEKDVLSKYNIANEKLKADPNITIKDAIAELENYQYPSFEFIVCGFDMDENMPYLYKVDEDGNSSNWNFLGFAVTGSGSALAFAELTKGYASDLPFSHALPRVSFAKRASERVQGVGRFTDLGYIILQLDPNNKTKFNPLLTLLSHDTPTMTMLDEAYDEMTKSEYSIIASLQQKIESLIQNAQKEQLEPKTIKNIN